MANEIIPFKDLAEGGTPMLFDQYGTDDLMALGAGIMGSYAVVSIRGKTWRVKWQGDETMIRDKANEPVRALQCVIVGVSSAISKTYYAGRYERDSAESPNCASIDGIRPDDGVPDQQSVLCANCPQNQFGSQVTDAGKKAKACGDHKRLAIVPANDFENEAFGGAMLLRIPAASLQGLIAFMQQLKAYRVPPFAVITQVSFDPEAEFPKLILTPQGAITDQGLLDRVLAVRAAIATQNVLYGTLGGGGSDALPVLNPSQTKEAAPAQPARKPGRPAKVVEPKPEPEPAQAEEQQEEPELPIVQPKAAKAPANGKTPVTVATPKVENELTDLLAGLGL